MNQGMYELQLCVRHQQQLGSAATFFFFWQITDTDVYNTCTLNSMNVHMQIRPVCNEIDLDSAVLGTAAIIHILFYEPD